MKIEIIGTIVIALICMATPVMAEPTPFVINGHVYDFYGDPCNGSYLQVTNTNTSASWDAQNSSASNYYQLVLDSDCVSADSILRFAVVCGGRSTITDYTVTTDDVNSGGFSLNITIGQLPGDINGDGDITAADATIVLRMAVRGEWSEEADVSGDHKVTSLDALMIMGWQDLGLT